MGASPGAAPVFDPATSLRHFRLAMTDIGEIVVLPRVTRATVRGSTVELRAAMADGRVDLAVGRLREHVARWFAEG